MNMKKSDPHAVDRGIRTTFGRIFMCGLAFCLLLSAIPAGVAASEVISLPDANLEAVVRDELGISGGDITDDDMAALHVLDADEKKISDLSGLEYAVNLRDLDLEDNQVSDLGPLANLTRLRELGLESNQVSDLSPLVNLTRLKKLDLEENQVSDLTPLAGLPYLRDLDLESNRVSDLTPLLDSKLSRGSSVKLYHNDLDFTPGSAAMRDIEALEERGVDVSY